MPAIPSCTVAGRFGIERTTGTPGAILLSMLEVGIAAATESTVCSGVRTLPISPRSVLKSCGLTAITTSSAPETASVFESSCLDAVALRQLGGPVLALTVTTISSGFRQPPLIRPRRSDSPIVPAPRIATRRCSTPRV